MKIPKTVQIGAHQLSVIQDGGIGNDDNYGKIVLEELKIFIRNNVPQSLQEETFFHECLHAIRELHGIERSDKEKEEQIVQIQAHGLYLLLKENNLLK